jgi:hypothetical protein
MCSPLSSRTGSASGRLKARGFAPPEQVAQREARRELPIVALEHAVTAKVADLAERGKSASVRRTTRAAALRCVREALMPFAAVSSLALPDRLPDLQLGVGGIVTLRGTGPPRHVRARCAPTGD